MRPGEPDHKAVTVLQQAIMAAGFPLEMGADGTFASRTATAVRLVQARFQLSRDSGHAGREVINALDKALAGGLRPPLTVVGAKLSLMLQRTKMSHPQKLAPYFERAGELLSEFELEITRVDKQLPHLDFHGTLDPGSPGDIQSIREASEKQTPGHSNVLRVIFADFVPRAPPFFGLTEGRKRTGMNVPDFILLNTAVLRDDKATLLHEMIHAALGFDGEDPDPTSIASQGSSRTVFKFEHAAAMSVAFFSSKKE
nr:peptidoglycan-binding domain-containing protein [Bosea caraganae]